MPSGGPPDEVPPEVVEAAPAAGAVNVAADEVRITFSEYVDQASFTRALSVSPPFERRLDVRWNGRTAVIPFPEPLRPNTTYILTIDTNLRDVNGVALRAPLTLAFSTGPTINRGRLAGRVVLPDDGRGAGGFDVYAYAAPGSAPPLPLPERPDYRTQTDETGAFAFTYLSEQPYYVVAVEDRNRNRRPDALEPFAVPPLPVLVADTMAHDATHRWVVTALDTVAPAPQRVRALSNRRFAVRFSEPVAFVARDPAAWMLRDSLGAVPAIAALYQLPGDPFQIHVVTDPLPGRPHRLRPGAVADTSGNAVRPDTLRFTPSAAADTVGTRFETFVPDTVGAAGVSVLPAGQAPAVRFNQPLDSTRLYAAVAVADTSGRALAFTAASPDGVTYLVETVPPLLPGQTIRLTVDGARLDGPDSLFARTFQRLPPGETGELTGTVVAADTTGALVVELYPEPPVGRAEPRRVRADAAGRFAFRDLPAGTYRLRAFVDRDGDLRWDGGRIAPYTPAEPLTWSTEAHRVRARWETALPDTVRILDL